MKRIPDVPENHSPLNRGSRAESISGKAVARALLVGGLIIGSLVGGISYVKHKYDQDIDALVNGKPAPNEICVDLTGVDANNTVIWNLADEYADGSRLVEDTDKMTLLLAQGGSIAYCRASDTSKLEANKVRNAEVVPSDQFVTEKVYSDAGGISTDIGQTCMSEKDLDNITARKTYLEGLGRVVQNVNEDNEKRNAHEPSQEAPERGIPTMLHELGMSCVKLAVALPSHIKEVLDTSENWQNSRVRRFGNKMLELYEPIARVADRVGDTFSQHQDPKDRVLSEAKRRSEELGESTVIYPFKQLWLRRQS